MNLYQAFGGNPVNFVDPWGMDSLSGLQKDLVKRMAEAMQGEGNRPSFAHPYAKDIGDNLAWRLKHDFVIVGRCSGAIAQWGIYGELVWISGWNFNLSSSWNGIKQGYRYGNTFVAIDENFLKRGVFEGTAYGSPLSINNKSRMFLFLTLYHEGVHANLGISGTAFSWLNQYRRWGYWIGLKNYQEYASTTQTIAFARHLRAQLLRVSGLITEVKAAGGLRAVMNTQISMNLTKNIQNYQKLLLKHKISNLTLPKTIPMAQHLGDLFGGSNLGDLLGAIDQFILSEQKYRYREVGRPYIQWLLNNWRSQGMTLKELVQEVCRVGNEFEYFIQIDPNTGQILYEKPLR